MPKSEIVIANDRVYHLGLKKGQLAPNILLVGDPARSYKVAAYFERVTHEIKNREYISLTGTYQGIPISVIGTGMGTDNVEIALAEIYTLFGFDFESSQKIADAPSLNLIRIGTSGGVQADIPAGTMGIARYALGMDSTGLYYDHSTPHNIIHAIEDQAYQLLTAATPVTARFKGKLFAYASMASKAVFNELVLQVKKAELPYSSGITASSPGFYGPSARYIEGLKNTVPNIKQVLSQLNVQGERVINMEMESSILFHICSELGYQAGTICPIISNPYSSASLVDYNLLIRRAIEIALASVLELSRTR